MNYFVVITLILFCYLSVILGQLPPMESLNYYAIQSASHSQGYAKQPKLVLSMENIMISSLEIAMETCKNSFKWERWNCPNSDFILRHTLQPLLLDREDSYVNAITLAAVLYTITKNCASGAIVECNSYSNNSFNLEYSYDLKAAEQLLKKHIRIEYADDYFGRILKHNYEAVVHLFEKSLIKQCNCEIMGSNGVCVKQICLQALKPFQDIADGIRQAYTNSLQLNNTPQNSHVIWDNIPLDALVYVRNSPNYCELDVVPHWNGMHDRSCATVVNGKNLTAEERSRCRYLCTECDYTIQSRSIITETHCNCKFTWNFQVHCELCKTIQKQYYCL